MFGGHVTLGFSKSRATTSNSQVAALPAESVAVQTTCVAPFWKFAPLAGMQTTGTLASQLSLAVRKKLTTALHNPGSVAASIRSGQLVKIGGSVSSIVTTKVQDLELPQASVAVHVTVVGP